MVVFSSVMPYDNDKKYVSWEKRVIPLSQGNFFAWRRCPGLGCVRFQIKLLSRGACFFRGCRKRSPYPQWFGGPTSAGRRGLSRVCGSTFHAAAKKGALQISRARLIHVCFFIRKKRWEKCENNLEKNVWAIIFTQKMICIHYGGENYE